MKPRDCGMPVSEIGFLRFLDLSQDPKDFGCIFDTCRILNCAKCSPVRESTKCRFRPRRHLTANVSSAARVFGSRTVVGSSPSECVWLAVQPTAIKQSRAEQIDSPGRRTMKPSWCWRMSAFWPLAYIPITWLGSAHLFTRTDCMNSRHDREWHRCLQPEVSSSSQLYLQSRCAARRPQSDLLIRRGPDWSCQDASPGLPRHKRERPGLAKRLGAPRETVRLSRHARRRYAGSLAVRRFRRTQRQGPLPSQPRCPVWQLRHCHF